MTSSNNKDFRSTFFTMKQSHIHQSKEKSEDADGDSVKVLLNLFRLKRSYQSIRISGRRII